MAVLKGSNKASPMSSSRVTYKEDSPVEHYRKIQYSLNQHLSLHILEPLHLTSIDFLQSAIVNSHKRPSQLSRQLPCFNST